MGSQHPLPNVKTLWHFEPQIWPELITSHNAESTCFKGSRTSCDVIHFGSLGAGKDHITWWMLPAEENWGVAEGSSVSWVAKFKGDKNSGCKLSNGWSRNKSASQSFMELCYPWISGPLRVSWKTLSVILLAGMVCPLSVLMSLLAYTDVPTAHRSHRSCLHLWIWALWLLWVSE